VRERHVFIWYCTWLACLFVKLQHDKTVDNPQEGSFVKHFKISKADPTLAFSSRNLYVHTTQNDCTISGEKNWFLFFGFAIFSCCMIAYSHSFYKTEIIHNYKKGEVMVSIWKCSRSIHTRSVHSDVFFSGIMIYILDCWYCRGIFLWFYNVFCFCDIIGLSD